MIFSRTWIFLCSNCFGVFEIKKARAGLAGLGWLMLGWAGWAGLAEAGLGWAGLAETCDSRPRSRLLLATTGGSRRSPVAPALVSAPGICYGPAMCPCARVGFQMCTHVKCWLHAGVCVRRKRIEFSLSIRVWQVAYVSRPAHNMTFL